METNEFQQAAQLEQFSRYIAQLAQHQQHAHGSGDSIETIREADHLGHHIVIKTTYTIQVDGQPLQAPLGLDNEGNLHCHSLPNYQFASAIDMVKSLIDNFPEDFAGGDTGATKPPAGGPHDHGSHEHKKEGE